MHTYTMFSLFLSLTLLGLAAVDPVGIAAMPILLSQERPMVRSFIFLLGSFLALVTVGLVLTQGLGALILHFETTHRWLIPSIEAMAGIILLIVAIYALHRNRNKQLSDVSSEFIMKRLRLGNWQLFLLGALLVTFQSIVDVVFVVAMIRIEVLHLEAIPLLAAIVTYAVAALLLQLIVVIMYRVAPIKQRTVVLHRIRDLITRHADRTIVVVSVVLGIGLLINAAFSIVAST